MGERGNRAGGEKRRVEEKWGKMGGGDDRKRRGRKIRA